MSLIKLEENIYYNLNDNLPSFYSDKKLDTLDMDKIICLHYVGDGMRMRQVLIPKCEYRIICVTNLLNYPPMIYTNTNPNPIWISNEEHNKVEQEYAIVIHKDTITVPEYTVSIK